MLSLFGPPCIYNFYSPNNGSQKKQDYQALLKAKYCPRVAAASRRQKNTPKTHVTLTFDLEIQQDSRGCRDTCSYKVSSTSVQRFTSCSANREKNTISV